MRRRVGALLAPALLAPALVTPPAAAAARLDPSAVSISFEEPVDFATGAEPSSAAFNVASGDQIHHMLARVPMSDSVTAGDFNRDGKLDVAQTNVIAGSVSVFLGNGQGGFAAPQQHPVGVYPVFVVTGDLDRDGMLDLAVADFGSDDVAILRGVGDGGFRPASFIPVPAPRNVAIGRFDGDDLPDLAVSSSPPGTGSIRTPNEPTPGAVAILTGTPTGAFVAAQLLSTTIDGRPVNANVVATADLNGDGRDDLAVGAGIRSNAGDRQNGDARLTGDDALIFLNRREAPGTPIGQPFNPAPDERIRIGAWPSAISVADLDGDADIDVAVLDTGSGDVTTLRNDGRGRFVRVAANVTVGALARSLAAGDLDNDGNLDLVTASFLASTVSVLQGNGDGTFQPAVDFWSGDAPTGATVGDFDADGRVDIAAGRLRDDHLALLLNDSPRRGDGVRIERDILYVDPKGDPLAAHHGLDVYVPPVGTASFAGVGRRYPVVFFAHGGGGISGDKSMVSYLMRSLARQGLVAVSVNYRLGPDLNAEQAADVARAFAWTRDNIGSGDRRGDPNNIFVSGYSAGALAAATVATHELYAGEQRHIRALALAGAPPALRPGAAKTLAPSLLLSGDEGLEIALAPSSADYARQCRDRGAESTHEVVAGRDHGTIVSDLARDGDPGRAHLLGFLKKHLLLTPEAVAADTAEGGGEGDDTLPATGAPATPLAVGVLWLVAAGLFRRNH